MNKAELEKKIAHAKVGAEMYSQQRDICLCDIKALETQLAELTKAKTGRVKIGDDLSGVGWVFIVNMGGEVVKFPLTSIAGNARLQGRTFYDRPSAELFTLREVTEYKIWCKFGDDVRVDILPWLESRTYLGVCYACRTPPEALHKFIDTLSPEELSSIRSE